MIRRIYVDNLGCLVNLELQLDRMQLLLGPNGSGKSTVLEALRRTQTLLGGARLRDAFPPARLTRWQASPVQRIEIEFSVSGSALTYELAVEHDEDRRLARITHESLCAGDTKLFGFDHGNVHLYRDDGSVGPTYPFDWSRSALGLVAPRNDNRLLTGFLQAMSALHVVAPVPALMSEISSGPLPSLGSHMEDLSAWYQHASQDQGVAMRVAESIRAVLSGFSHFRFSQSGDKWRLDAEFEGTAGATSYRFSELSDGERMLAALYMLALATPRDGVVLVDEPASYVGLPEISPWMDLVTDRCDDGEIQVVVISHHPVWIDRKAATRGLWMDRDAGGPTRVARLDAPRPGLSLSSLVERGWLAGT